MVELCLVVPCFNEIASLDLFISEWIAELSKYSIPYKILFVDGGSSDGTIEFIKSHPAWQQSLDLEVRPGLLHGPSCLEGYRVAIAMSAAWVLQLDSDGQCDPAYFKQFWDHKEKNSSVQGFRFNRGDGLLRLAISRALSFTVFCLSKVWIKDANVPYRLMHADVLSRLLPLIPPDFEMSQVMLSLLYKRFHNIVWIPIKFRQRSAGAGKCNLKHIWRAARGFVSTFETVASVK